MPGYEWYQDHGIQCTKGSNAWKLIRDMCDLLLDMVNSLNLTQLINVPNVSNVFLDLAFSNISGSVSEVSMDPLCKLDVAHFAYIIEFNVCVLPDLDYSVIAFDYKKGDYQGLQASLCTTDFLLLVIVDYLWMLGLRPSMMFCMRIFLVMYQRHVLRTLIILLGSPVI